jgi:hypothetical protein
MPPRPTGNGGTATKSKPVVGTPVAARNGKRPTSIANLGTMPLTNTPELCAWTNAARHMARAFAMEAETAATHVERRMAGVGQGRVKSLVTRAAARRAMRRYHRAAHNINSAADNFARGWADYRRAFPELINPENRRGAWDFREQPARR